MSENEGGAARWSPDPLGRYQLRWWDGSAWTDQVSVDGSAVAADPLGVTTVQAEVAPDRLVVGSLDSPSAPPVPVQNAPLPQQQPPQVQYIPAQQPQQQTPNFNLPGGGAWAAPQQVVVTNASKSPGMAISSLILGVGAFFVALIPVVGLASIPFAIVGVCLGIAGIMRSLKGFEGRGLSIAGLVAGLAALFVSAIYLFAFGSAASQVDADPSNGVCNTERILQDPDC